MKRGTVVGAQRGSTFEVLTVQLENVDPDDTVGIKVRHAIRHVCMGDLVEYDSHHVTVRAPGATLGYVLERIKWEGSKR